MGIVDGFQLLLAAQVGVHHPPLDRARADNGDFNDQFIKIAWLQARQHAHLCAGFNLENPHGIRAAYHFIDGRVVRGDIL